MKYSIWVVPPKLVLKKLQVLVDNLAKEYDAPTFEPHLTVLAEIDSNIEEIEEKLNKLNFKYSELQLETENFSFSTTYFQSVLIRIKPTAQLLELNLELKQIFNMENNLFMPHISLLYGDYSMEVRESIVNRLESMNLNFSVDRLIVTPSTPNPKNWTHDLIVPFKI